MLHKDGHSNQAGGCCCPDCGNTCGFHTEWQRHATLQMPKLPDEVDNEAHELALKNLDRMIKKNK